MWLSRILLYLLGILQVRRVSKVSRALLWSLFPKHLIKQQAQSVTGHTIIPKDSQMPSTSACPWSERLPRNLEGFILRSFRDASK